MDDNNIITEVILISPKQYFSSDIIQTTINIFGLAEEGYLIKQIQISKRLADDLMPPPMPEIVADFPPPPTEMSENIESFTEKLPTNTYYLKVAVNQFSHDQKFEKATQFAEKLATLEPTEENILNLQELYLLNNQATKAIELQKKHYSSIKTSEHRVLANFHVFVAKLLTNKNDETIVKNIKEALLFLDFNKFSWSFDMLENHIASDKSISQVHKDKIIGLITDIKAANYDREEDTISRGNYEELSFEAPPPVQEVVVEISSSKKDEEPIFTSVEQNPEYPGGIKEMYNFIQANLIYPETARSLKISGKVFLKFIIEKDGSVGNEIQILKGIHPDCDAEASRLVKSFPKWTPGYQNGKAVRVYYTIPINFMLD